MTSALDRDREREARDERRIAEFARSRLDAVPNVRCAHLGEPTGKTIQCDTCAGKVMLKVIGCAVFGECVPLRKIDNVASCIGCQSYVSLN